MTGSASLLSTGFGWVRDPGKSPIPNAIRGDVGGIFISYSGFSSAAIEDAKTGLTQKVFFLAELQEIIETLEHEGDLKAFFKEKINRAKSDRNPFFKAQG